MLNLKELREKLTSDDILKILSRFDVKCVQETDKACIFPTVCHNLSGGSPKLYYYKNNHLFKCYTQCEGLFDIFELLIKMQKLRGNNISIYEAVKMCGINTSPIKEETYQNIEDDINYLYNLLKTKNKLIKLPQLDERIMDRFIFDKNVLQIWANEGISFETMKKYNIKYDPIQNCIIIPNFDIDNRLISIRGRFLSEDADAKYKPIYYGDKLLSHPSSMCLYGLNITKDAIKKHKKVIIFESEKSVMMMDTYYGEDNCSVATLGKNISLYQIRLLIQLGVNEVILAFDRDYIDYETMVDVRNEYALIAKTLKTYFNVCYLIDLDFNLLHYKDSPIDRGKDKLEELLKNRIYV